jgi:hypothetical protein
MKAIKGGFMKFKVSVLIMALTVLAAAAPASAWYYAVGTGGGGKADASGFSIEVGKENVMIAGRSFLFAGEIPVILHGDKHVPSGTHSGPVAHSDYTFISKDNDGTERGLLAKAGMKIKDYDLYGTLILGLTKANTVTVVKSNPTGDNYIQERRSEMNGVFGIGISYFPVFKALDLKMNVQLEIDNRRGVTGLVGWCW